MQDLKEYKTYYSNSNLKEKWYIKNGKLEGEYLWYYENSQLWEKGYYRNGKKEGGIFIILL